MSRPCGRSRPTPRPGWRSRPCGHSRPGPGSGPMTGGMMTTTTTELLNDRIAGVPAIQPARAYSLAEVEQMARHAAASRMYGMDQAQAFTLMMLCYSDGLDPIQAVRRYHVIQGRPSMRADAMLAEFQRQGGTVEWIRTDDRGCEAIFRHPRHAPKGQRVTFTLEDATRAELSGKDNWR